MDREQAPKQKHQPPEISLNETRPAGRSLEMPGTQAAENEDMPGSSPGGGTHPNTSEEIEMDSLLTCPRACGVDIRLHHSTGKVNGGCDTGPMSLDEMCAWFEIRGAGQPGFSTTAELIAEHYGKSEDELDEIYDAQCGSMARPLKLAPHTGAPS